MHFTQKRPYDEVNGKNVRELSTRLVHSKFIRISHVKSQPITKKHFAQEHNFLRSTNEHSPIGQCLRTDNYDINEVLSP